MDEPSPDVKGSASKGAGRLIIQHATATADPAKKPVRVAERTAPATPSAEPDREAHRSIVSAFKPLRGVRHPVAIVGPAAARRPCSRRSLMLLA